jgi:hypothetical protein
MLVSCHALAEFYRVLTSIKTSPQIKCSQVLRILSDDIVKFATIVELNAIDYVALLQSLAQRSIRGGPVYDAIPVAAAIQVNADQVITLNFSDFTRVWPNPPHRVINPFTTPAP